MTTNIGHVLTQHNKLTQQINKYAIMFSSPIVVITQIAKVGGEIIMSSTSQLLYYNIVFIITQLTLFCGQMALVFLWFCCLNPRIENQRIMRSRGSPNLSDSSLQHRGFTNAFLLNSFSSSFVWSCVRIMRNLSIFVS